MQVSAKELAAIVSTLLVDPGAVGELDERATYLRFLEDIATVVADYCGGEIAGRADDDFGQPLVTVTPNDSLPNRLNNIWLSALPAQGLHDHVAFRIVGPDDPDEGAMAWSNSEGWVPTAQASVFVRPRDKVSSLDLPVEASGVLLASEEETAASIRAFSADRRASMARALAPWFAELEGATAVTVIYEGGRIREARCDTPIDLEVIDFDVDEDEPEGGFCFDAATKQVFDRFVLRNIPGAVDALTVRIELEGGRVRVAHSPRSVHVIVHDYGAPQYDDEIKGTSAIRRDAQQRDYVSYEVPVSVGVEVEWTYDSAVEALDKGPLPADFTGWDWKNKYGWTVAHVAAGKGHLPAGFTGCGSGCDEIDIVGEQW